MVLRGTEPRLAKRHSPSLQFFLICKEREGALSKKSPLLIKEYFFSRDEEGGKNAGLHPRARTVHMAESLRCQPKEIHQRETRRKRWRLSGRKRGKHRVVSQGRRLALENWSPSTKAIGHFFPSQEPGPGLSTHQSQPLRAGVSKMSGTSREEAAPLQS